MMATANSDWAAVNSSSRRCEPAIGNPCRLRDEIANTSGSDPTSRVHWLTLELTRAPEGGVGLQPPREQPRDDELRRLGRKRRQPLHQEELRDAVVPSGGDQRVCERLGAQQDHEGGPEEQQPDGQPPPPRGEPAEPPRGTDQMWLRGRRLGQPAHVQPEQRDEHDRVEQRDRMLQRQRQRVERRRRQVRDLDGVGTLEPDAGERRLRGLDPAPAARPVPGDEHHAAPPEADQQPVGAGHVGQRQRARRRQAGLVARARRPVEPHRLAALPGEDEVDGVLGQHRDQREQGEGESRRDVELRDLRGPGQDERGSHDREPEEQSLDTVGQMRLGPAEPEGRYGCKQGETEDESNAPERGGGLRRGRHRLWRP